MPFFTTFAKALCWLDAFGLRAGVGNLVQLAGRGPEARFRVPGSLGQEQALVARRNRSDTVMFHQVFVLREYDYDLGFEPSSILDAGANAGYATRFFRQRYPRAAVIAVEPDPENCQVFRRNTVHLRDVQLIQGGLWGMAGWLRVAQPDASKSELRLEVATGEGPDALRAYTIPDLLREQGWSSVDLIKLDVEGAEREIFAAGDVGWLHGTRALIVELHDRTTPGCAQALFKALQGFNYDVQQRGDTLLVRFRHAPEPEGSAQLT